MIDSTILNLISAFAIVLAVAPLYSIIKKYHEFRGDSVKLKTTKISITPSEVETHASGNVIVSNSEIKPLKIHVESAGDDIETLHKEIEILKQKIEELEKDDTRKRKLRKVSKQIELVWDIKGAADSIKSSGKVKENG